MYGLSIVAFDPWTLRVTLRALERDLEEQGRHEFSQPGLGQGWSVGYALWHSIKGPDLRPPTAKADPRVGIRATSLLGQEVAAVSNS
jgi:hypothetical protein